MSFTDFEKDHDKNVDCFRDTVAKILGLYRSNIVVTKVSGSRFK